MTLPKSIARLASTTIKSKPKDELVEYILNLYQEIDHIMQALHYIHEDLDLIENGDAYRVHDNP